jgi:protoheme IX farnesyltransferase
MERTKQRALAAGRISTANALLFATLLGLIGFATLGTLTNPLTVSVASIGFAVYVVLYSMWKGKTIYATAIGSIAGATPPLVGYCAASNQFDLGASILFAVLVFWQMPHFFSIAMYRFTDYSKAAIPVLPIVKGSYCAKKRMLGYILAFIISATALTFFEFTSNYYMTSITLLGIAWLALCLKGFYTSNENKWAYQMFVFSLVTINGLCLMIAIDAMTHW